MEWTSLKRFLHYSLFGFATFLIDTLLLYILKEFFDVNYLIATSAGFTVGVSINYLLSRHYVFVGSTRGYKSGYGYFFLIAGLGLFFITSSMYVMVSFWEFNYLFSRVLIAAIVGIWNYSMNLFFNFKLQKLSNKLLLL